MSSNLSGISHGTHSFLQPLDYFDPTTGKIARAFA